MPEKDAFTGKNILVTGGSGSFGRAVVEELLTRGSKVVRIFDHDENGLWALQESHRGQSRLRYLLGDVRDLDRVRMACQDIDVVIHAAALKHVPSCEYNPFEAVRTNVMGTQNVIQAALDCNVEKFLLTSSDKAANPSNVMGTTKLLAEKLAIAANYYRGKHRTVFSAVRFGNVLGSRGSASLLFRDQVLEGGPVTLTDSRMTRFVMTLPDAVRLVLRAVAMSRGAETFILKMAAARISDLAAVVIEEGAAKSGTEIGTAKTGARPGEKLYEELMTEEEVSRAYELSDMYLLLSNVPELLPADLRAYPGAKPAKQVAYRSDRVAPLARAELAGLLKAEGLL